LPFYFAAAKKSYLHLQYQLQLVYMIPADCIQLYTYSIYSVMINMIIWSTACIQVSFYTRTDNKKEKSEGKSLLTSVDMTDTPCSSVMIPETIVQVYVTWPSTNRFCKPPSILSAVEIRKWNLVFVCCYIKAIMLNNGDRAGNNAFNPRPRDKIWLIAPKAKFNIISHPPFPV